MASGRVHAAHGPLLLLPDDAACWLEDVPLLDDDDTSPDDADDADEKDDGEELEALLASWLPELCALLPALNALLLEDDAVDVTTAQLPATHAYPLRHCALLLQALSLVAWPVHPTAITQPQATASTAVQRVR